MRKEITVIGLIISVVSLPFVAMGLVPQKTFRQEPYQVEVPYQVSETQYSKWIIEWYSISYSGTDVIWGSNLDQSNKSGSNSLIFNWGSGTVFSSYSDYVGLRASETIYVPSSRQVRFTLGSDDGSILFVDGVSVINNWGIHKYSEKKASPFLNEGKHVINIWYAERTEAARLTFYYEAYDASISWTEMVTKYRNETKYRSGPTTYLNINLLFFGGLFLLTGLIIFVVGIVLKPIEEQT